MFVFAPMNDMKIARAAREDVSVLKRLVDSAYLGGNSRNG